MNIVVDSNGLVLMIGGIPTPPSGATLITLNDQQAAALQAMPPNDGLIFDGQNFTPVAPRTPVDLSNADTLEKAVKAVLLAAGAMAGKTVAQTRAAFSAAWQALP